MKKQAAKLRKAVQVYIYAEMYGSSLSCKSFRSQKEEEAKTSKELPKPQLQTAVSIYNYTQTVIYSMQYTTIYT